MLLVEIIVTRLFSVLFYYHFSFFAVSLVMSGLVIGGILAARTDAHDGSDEEYDRRLSVLSARFSASVVAALLAITVFSQPDAGSAPSLLMVGLYGVVFLPGLIAAGAFLALAFARDKSWIGTLYAWDLVAAAIACISAIALLRLLQGPIVLLAPALFAAVGSMMLARSRRQILAGAALGAVCVGLVVADAFAVHPLFSISQQQSATSILERWNEHSRVMGLQLVPESRKLIIDRAAATDMRWIPPKSDGSPVDPDPTWSQGDQYSVYSLGRPLDDVAIIGVGGGQDLLPPIEHGAKRVYGYELNRTFIDLLESDFKDYNAIATRPELTLIHSEARVGIAHSGRQYDVIQASLIDTWAATASGGFVLSESGLYSREGWQVFLSHLTDTGILTMTRWHIPEAPAETHRLLALAAASLVDAGIADPRGHIVFLRSTRNDDDIMFRRGELTMFGTILVSKTPFSQEEISRLRTWCAINSGQILVAPGAPSSEAVFDQLLDPATRQAAVDASAYNITPPDDLQPYFFLQVRPADILNLGSSDYSVVTEITFNGVRVMMILGACAVLLVIAVLLLTVFTLPGSHATPGGRRVYRWMSLYFLGIGFGYIMIQLGLHQRLIIILGHPTLALSVVLFSMLLGTGVGAAISGRLFSTGDLRRVAGVIVGVLALLWLAIPLFPSFESIGSYSLRLASISAMLVIVGCVLGFAFPVGVRQVAPTGEWAVQKMWAINGAASIAASVLAAVVGLTMGTRNVLLFGVLAYVVAGIAGIVAQSTSIPEADRAADLSDGTAESST